MRKFSIMCFVLCGLTILFSCARIRQYNTTIKPHEFPMKKVRATLTNGEIIEKTHAVFDKEREALIIKNEPDSISFNLQELAALQYSNSNLGMPGGIIGGAAGLLLGLSTRSEHKNTSKASFYEISYPDEEVAIGMVFIPVASYLGYLIGSKIYYNWRKFDLDAYRENALQPYFSFGDHGIGIGVRIPLRK